MAHTTREEWLNAFAAHTRPYFEDAGHPLPDNIRMSVGFSSKGNKGKRIGECWSDTASADKTFEIFIVPGLHKVEEIAATLTHELVHVAVGLEAKHGPVFKKCATALGLVGKMTATTGGDDWVKWALPILEVLGPIPHAQLGRGGGGETSAPKEQKGRNIKVECDTCGFTFRTTQKWIDAADGIMNCPAHSCSGACLADKGE